MIKLSGYTTNYGEDPECLSIVLGLIHGSVTFSPKHKKKAAFITCDIF